MAIILFRIWMVRASHLTENCKSARIGVRSFVTTVALDCSSSVDHGEDSYQVRGLCQSPPQCLPGSLDRAH